MSSHRLIAAIVAILISGCSTLTYQEPQAGPRARVRFVTDTNEITVLRTYGDKNCSTNEAEWLRLRNGILLNSSPKRLGMPLWNYHDNAAKEVYVEANRPIYGMFQGGETTGGKIYQCGAPFRYTFDERGDYEVKFKWARQECRVIVSKITENTAGPQQQELATFSNQLNEDNAGCLSPFYKSRAY